MLRRRDPVAIGNVGSYTESMSHELTVALAKLIQDINSISDSYKGVDADLEIAKFIETANKINIVIRNFDYYGKYMKNVSGHDRDNLDRTVKKLEEHKKQPTVLESDVALQTLSLDTINNYNIEGDING